MATKTLAALAAAALVIAVSPSVEAQTVVGLGFKPCSEFTALSSKSVKDVELRLIAISWVQGFASAVNVVLKGLGGEDAPDILAGAELSVIAEGVNAYCKANPKDQVSNAAMAVVSKLGKDAKLDQSLLGGKQ